MDIYIHPPYLVCDGSFHNIFVPGKSFFIKYPNSEQYSVNTYVFDHMWTFNATPLRRRRRTTRFSANINHKVAFDISAQGFNTGDVKVTADAHESFHEDNLLHGSLDLENNASMLVSKSKYNEVTQNILAPSSIWNENHQLSEELPRIRFDGTNYKLRLELEFGQDGISVKVSEFRATKQSPSSSSLDSPTSSSSSTADVDSWLFTNRLLSGIIFDEDDDSPLNSVNNNSNNSNNNNNRSLSLFNAPLLSPSASSYRTALGSGASTPITPSTPLSSVSSTFPSLSSPTPTSSSFSTSANRRKDEGLTRLKGWFRQTIGPFSKFGGSAPASPSRSSYSFLPFPHTSTQSSSSAPTSPTSPTPPTTGLDSVGAFIRELDTIIPGWITPQDARAFAQLSSSMNNNHSQSASSHHYDLSVPDPDIPESLPLPPPPYIQAPPYEP